MFNILKEKLKAFKEQKKNREIVFVKVRGAGVASIDTKSLLTSKKVKNVIENIKKSKLQRI